MTHSAPHPPRKAGRWRVVSALVALVIGCLLAFTYVSVVVQQTAAAYVRGESLWSTSQKIAVIQLLRFVDTRDQANVEAARVALLLPRADRRARLLVEHEHPDYDAAAQAFVEGGNDPRDARQMARLYPVSQSIPAMRRAVSAWRTGDAYIDSLEVAGAGLVAAVHAGDTAAVARSKVRLEALDSRLSWVEREFSDALGDGSRQIPVLVLAIGLFAGLALAGITLLVVRRFALLESTAAALEHQRLEELRSLVDDAPDPILRFDREHRVTYANAAVERVVGVPREGLLGMTHEVLTTQSSAAAATTWSWESALGRAFDGRADVHGEFEVPDSAGGPSRPFLCRLAPVRSVTGHTESVIAIARDVTALRESERALRAREDDLRHAQKLEAVGLLAGGIAHEFNNILTAIIGNLELAADSLDESHPVRADVEQARGAANRATGLTRQLLAFGRKQLLEPQRLEVNGLVSELETMLHRLVGERVTLETHPSPSPAWVCVDPGQFQQVLLNLVVNARDAMPEGGSIVIEVSLDLCSAEPCVCVTVRDSGVGMSLATRQRVFEPFFTTKASTGGSGLGLAVVHGIVAQAGGRIDIDTALGEGTTVAVRLPAVQAEETPAAGAWVEPAPHDGTILLVEDEESVRAITRRILERAGYRVVEAQHAEDALLLWTRANAGDSPIDILVTDLMMPGIGGMALVHRLRLERPSLPVLVVSGYTGEVELATAGPDDASRVATLRKPFTREELLSRIAAACETAGTT